jgi:hypothetical protein
MDEGRTGAVPERPLLKLPTPEDFIPRRPIGGGGSISRPTRERQTAKFGPRFERLANVADSPEQLLALRADPASIAPERAIVFEVEGSLDDFYAQAKSIGLDYLGDFEEEFDPTADFFNKKTPDKKIGGRIYLAMPDVQALRELLSLWNRYRENRRMPNGRGQWTALFSQLIDVRPWGPLDRIPEGAVEAWEEDLANAPDQPVRLEIELWFHERPDRREAAFADVVAAIADAGGMVVDHAVIAEIHYDAALVDIPAQYVRNLIDHQNVNLVRQDEIMFLRPQSIIENPANAEFHGAENPAQPEAVTFDSDQPIAALLDGLPIQNHVRLVNRLIVDDPENLEPSYAVAQRAHGTEMASLIVHGDLNRAGSPI